MGYSETRDNGGLQWRVTAKPGIKVGFSGGLLLKQGQWWAPVAGYCEIKAVNCMNSRTTIRFAEAILALLLLYCCCYYHYYCYTAVVTTIITVILLLLPLLLLYCCCYYHYHHGHHPHQWVSTFFEDLEATSKFKPPQS